MTNEESIQLEVSDHYQIAGLLGYFQIWTMLTSQTESSFIVVLF